MIDLDVPLGTLINNDASAFSNDFDPILVDSYASVSGTVIFILGGDVFSRRL